MPSSAVGKASPEKAVELVYQTERGTAYRAEIEDFLDSEDAKRYRRKVQLILTSPPFPLVFKKAYGNKTGEEYLAWLAGLAPRLREFLKPEGSIVIEVGNSWERGRPVMSTLALRSLLAFQERGDFELCQQFVCYNPARLPAPAQWVNVERIRVKDAYTHVWWMAPSDRPYADNSKILVEYSDSMRKLFARRSNNAGPRPSGHRMPGQSFLKRNAGAIPPNVIADPESVLAYSNTVSSDPYLQYCKEHEIATHPARMQRKLAEYFVKFLTNPRHLVLDPFAGSNTTGSVAEELKRRWVAIDSNYDYLRGSLGRFEK